MADKDSKLSKELLHTIFEYKDGCLYNKIYRSSKSKIGDKAGTLAATGYYTTYVNSVRFSIHRLIFLMHHGYLPKVIDHINGIKTDNRIENLREATNSENNCNRKSNNKSGIRGVHWNKYHKKWTAVCWKDRKAYYLGHFKNIEDAKKAIFEGRKKHHKEFANYE
jgi:hypothetical protein